MDFIPTKYTVISYCTELIGSLQSPGIIKQGTGCGGGVGVIIFMKSDLYIRELTPISFEWNKVPCAGTRLAYDVTLTLLLFLSNRVISLKKINPAKTKHN